MKERTIVKYPNRRLYDKEDNHYIAFEDLKNLILQNIPFTIVDVKTKEDVTYKTIVSLIAEKKEIAESFTIDFLKNIIRVYGYSQTQQNLFKDYFNNILQIALTAQTNLLIKKKDE